MNELLNELISRFALTRHEIPENFIDY